MHGDFGPLLRFILRYWQKQFLVTFSSGPDTAFPVFYLVYGFFMAPNPAPQFPNEDDTRWWQQEFFRGVLKTEYLLSSVFGGFRACTSPVVAVLSLHHCILCAPIACDEQSGSGDLWMHYSFKFMCKMDGIIFIQVVLTLSLLSSKSVFSQPFKKRLYEWCSDNL